MILLVPSCIIPDFGGEFKTSKILLENRTNFRKKVTNSRILEQFEHSPATFWQRLTGKNVDKTFFCCCCIPSYQERAQSDQMLQRCLEHCLLSTTNQWVFFLNPLHYNLSAVIHQKGPHYKKKPKFLRIFGNCREFLDNFFDISKII